MTLETKQRYFERLVRDWAKADKECGRAYLLWQAACERRLQAAIAKNNAYGELQMARAEASSVSRPVRESPHD